MLFNSVAQHNSLIGFLAKCCSIRLANEAILIYYIISKFISAKPLDMCMPGGPTHHQFGYWFFAHGFDLFSSALLWSHENILFQITWGADIVAISFTAMLALHAQVSSVSLSLFGAGSLLWLWLTFQTIDFFFPPQVKNENLFLCHSSRLNEMIYSIPFKYLWFQFGVWV